MDGEGTKMDVEMGRSVGKRPLRSLSMERDRKKLEKR